MTTHLDETMATSKLSPQDRKDLDKFTKYLVYKCAQIIIQSRSGEKINTPSKLVSSGSDWFNLSIRDDPDIQTEIRSIYGSCSLMDGQKVCFEISVKTSEGEETVLETWYLETADYSDPMSRVSCSVYTRMGVLLKSLLLVTRAVPGYRVSREQGPDRYVMCYRIYLGMPKFNNLGDNYVKHTVGLVPSPVGTIALCVAYRAKKDLSVKHHLADALAKDFRDNYYHSESVPHSKSDLCCARSESAVGEGHKFDKTDNRRRSAADVYSHVDALDDVCEVGWNIPDDEYSHEAVAGKEITARSHIPKPDTTSFPCSCQLFNKPESAEPCSKKIEVLNQEKSDENIFALETDSKGTSLKRSLQPMVVGSSSSASDHSSPSAASAPDDFVVLEMKSDEGRDNEELGKFYHDCKAAPPLSMFQQPADLQEMLNSITDQLAQFEANAKDFDEFVNSITEDVN